GRADPGPGAPDRAVVRPAHDPDRAGRPAAVVATAAAGGAGHGTQRAAGRAQRAVRPLAVAGVRHPVAAGAGVRRRPAAARAGDRTLYRRALWSRPTRWTDDRAARALRLAHLGGTPRHRGLGAPGRLGDGRHRRPGRGGLGGADRSAGRPRPALVRHADARGRAALARLTATPATGAATTCRGAGFAASWALHTPAYSEHDGRSPRSHALPAPVRAARPGLHHPAQPRAHGLDAYRAGGSQARLPQAGRIFRRTRRRRRGADRHGWLLAQLRRLADPVRQPPGLALGSAQASAGDR